MLDLGVLKGLSWKPVAPQTLAAARKTLGGMTFTFDRELDPAPLDGRAAQILTAWFSTDQPLDPARIVRGAVKIDANRVIWAADPADLGRVLEAAPQTGGTVLLDLNCDFVIDRDGQPVSACSSTLIGHHLPRPGGILRTWLQIQKAGTG
jgi:hypothetical protein